MLRFIVVASLFAFACGLELGPVRGIGQSPIVGGEQASIEDAPYQVALLYDSTGLGIYSLRCGGSIISPSIILTAGHCTSGTRANRWRIRAGSSSHGSGGETVNGASVFTHEKFSSQTLDFDIAVIILSKALTINDVSTKVATLPTLGQKVEAGELAFVTGWGTTSSGGSIPSVLRKVTIPVVDQEVCSNAYQGFNTITDNMVCAGLFGVGGADACQGDSGGPFVVNDVLVGVTSWGKGCAQANSPGVWTRVPSLVDWVESHM